MLPTTKTAIMMAVAHTSAAEHAERSDKRIVARVAVGQKALKTAGGLPSLSGERYPLFYPSGRSEANVGAYKLAGWAERTNAECRESTLGRRATYMCASRGRVVPNMLESLLAYFGNPSELSSRVLASFLPEKVSAKEAKALVPSLISHVRTLPPTDAEISALIRSINPGSGHAGGRPRKVRTYIGTLAGHSRTFASDAVPAPSTPSQQGTGTPGYVRPFGSGAANVAALLDAFHAATLRQSAESCAE